MSMTLSKEQHKLLDRFLECVLERYRLAIDLMFARSALAQAFGLIAKQDSNITAFMEACLEEAGER